MLRNTQRSAAEIPRPARTPFQQWFDSILAAEGWTLRETARRLRVAPSTAFHYRAGTMLPAVRMQRALATVTRTPVERIADRVWRSKGLDLHPIEPTVVAVGAPIPRRRRWRAPPLGIAFTMYRTGAVRADTIRRLHTLALARRTSLDVILDEAITSALPGMERRGRQG